MPYSHNFTWCEFSFMLYSRNFYVKSHWNCASFSLKITKNGENRYSHISRFTQMVRSEISFSFTLNSRNFCSQSITNIVLDVRCFDATSRVFEFGYQKMNMFDSNPLKIDVLICSMSNSVLCLVSDVRLFKAKNDWVHLMLKK